MKKLLSIVLSVVIAGAAVASVPASNAVRCALNIYQWDSASSHDRLLWADTADFVKGKIVTGFAAGLSVDVNVTKIDTVSTEIMVHAYTFAPQPQHGARNFNIEYGLPGRVSNLIGKNGARFSLTVTPLKAVSVDTAWCPYSHHEAKDFAIDPTAHMNIYYVERSLGDYYWNSIKGILEEEYDNLNRMLNFSMPGKYLLFICPCKINTVIWDDRFAMMVDPVRSTIFAVYSKERNSVFPFLISQAAIYHNYGYAPAFLADGFANYSSFAIHEMKQMLREKRSFPLDSLMDTYSYFQYDPLTSDRVSATFVRYLINQYQIGLFLELYRKADDLNLRATIESTYGKTLDQLKAEWLHYVDTVGISFEELAYHTGLAEARFDYTTAHDYAKEMIEKASNFRDTYETSTTLSRTAFFAGDYQAAATRQTAVIKLIDTLASEWMQLAGYRLMNGEYDSAAADLNRARELDSSSTLIPFNQGLYKLCVGDTASARQLFSQVIAAGGRTGGLSESQVMLGNILSHSSVAADKKEALNYYNATIAALTQADTRHNPSASQMMWLGIAYLGSGDTENAESCLQTAMFLETRVFYLGMVNLWLGKVADVRGERALAREYYQKVLAGSSAAYHQEEARLLLQRPYRR